jgi:predicted Zn-dependent protease
LENLEYLYDQKQINFPDRMMLAEFDIAAGKTDVARKILDEAEAIYPYNVPAIHDLRGRSFLLSKQPNQALPWYKQYLAENNNDDQTTYTIARLYAQMGSHETEAWQWLEDAMKKGFNYSWVLKYDLVWEKYRDTPKWKELLLRYPSVRTYASTFHN